MGFSFNIYEKGENWILSKSETAEKILDFLEANPFGKISKMDVNNDLEMLPYNRRVVLNEFANNEIAGINIETESPLLSWGAISHDRFGKGFYLEIADEDVAQVNLDQVKAYLKNGRKIFPDFSWAIATADNRDNDFFYRQLKLLPVPECLGHLLGWYHLVSPPGFQPYFKRQDLLNAPAYDIEELEDGTICLMTYPHPLEFGTEENTARLIELTNYLYHKWMEHAPLPESLTNPGFSQ
jgi:hypothetical protein